MRELVVRFRISPELANLLFGILAAAAINVLTDVGVSGAGHGHRYLAIGGGLLLCSALAAGALALLVSGIRRSVEGLSVPTLTLAEIRAEESVRYRDAASAIVALLSLMAGLFGAGLALCFL